MSNLYPHVMVFKEESAREHRRVKFVLDLEQVYQPDVYGSILLPFQNSSKIDNIQKKFILMYSCDTPDGPWSLVFTKQGLKPPTNYLPILDQHTIFLSSFFQTIFINIQRWWAICKRDYHTKLQNGTGRRSKHPTHHFACRTF